MVQVQSKAEKQDLTELAVCVCAAVLLCCSGAVEPKEWTTAERLRLNFPPHGAPGNARLRLACQVGGVVQGMLD